MNTLTSTEAITKIDTWYMTQLAYFLQRLTDVKENGVSLLESTCVLFTSEIQMPNTHEQWSMPFLLAGGGGALRGGRYLTYDQVPHNNLLVSLLNAYGIADQTFGHPDFCTGDLPGLLT